MKLALVGRPNVGKSALFNRICRKRLSIIDEEEGVTRDRLYAKADFFGNGFDVIDTAGIDLHTNKIFNDEVLFQTEIAIKEADVIVMVVDGKIGQTSLDKEVADLLLKEKKPVVLAVNKVDSFQDDIFINKFRSLGIKGIVAVSATQGYHIAELLEEAFKDVVFPEQDMEDANKKPFKIALIGKENVGKSTLLNFVVNDNRTVVSEVPGTTRDSIDVDMTYKGTNYTFIDTAGFRKKNKERDVIDKFARIRTEKAIKNADICILMIDAKSGFSVHDKKIAKFIRESKKGCLILFNKWDLIKGFRMEHCEKTLREEFSFIGSYPILFISAKTGRNVDTVFEKIDEVVKAQNKKISTGVLNKFIEGCLQKYHPPMINGKRLRIYYLTQKSVAPLLFVLFVNRKDLMTKTYQKYLINRLCAEFKLNGIPIGFEIKAKRDFEKNN